MFKRKKPSDSNRTALDRRWQKPYVRGAVDPNIFRHPSGRQIAIDQSGVATVVDPLPALAVTTLGLL